MKFDRATTALQFSGGKDSLAVLYLSRDILDEITVYHVDTGDQYPETRAVIDEVSKWIPHLIVIKSDAVAWREVNGMPSDLVPTNSTWHGNLMGFGDVRLSDKFSCCFNNMMLPMYQRMKADGIKTIIRGTKKADMPALPVSHGSVIDGFEILHPIETWTDEDVHSYLREVGAPVADYYADLTGSASDCLGCTAWWSESRAGYLKKAHPVVFHEYMDSLKKIKAAALDALSELDAELAAEG